MFVIRCPGSPFEALCRRFKRGVEAAGILREARHRLRLAPAPEQATVGRERDAAVRAAIASLSDRDRQLVHAFFYDPTAPSYAKIVGVVM